MAPGEANGEATAVESVSDTVMIAVGGRAGRADGAAGAHPAASASPSARTSRGWAPPLLPWRERGGRRTGLISLPAQVEKRRRDSRAPSAITVAVQRGTPAPHLAQLATHLVQELAGKGK